ncbi:hypothetical protein [Pontibacter sp. G13]|uniref:hypothetical protein n=1 Tax=Pontibacter sp. G13 TaxID=3074898 RepID=UPI00288B321E|nr:hypothetical protein [Pontibacter sp. G13]WNJ19315.1 hypothetical protein RJD25_02385 [Pontibacter sp. G13]
MKKIFTVFTLLLLSCLSFSPTDSIGSGTESLPALAQAGQSMMRLSDLPNRKMTQQFKQFDLSDKAEVLP